MSGLRARHWTLGLLCLFAIVSFIDRQIISVLIEPIKRDLKLSDTMLGALAGTAFALFYVFASFPIARWADRGDRRLVVSLCCLVCSVATTLSGFAQSFLHLALARIGVAVGESGANPVSQALLTDIFSPKRRATVLSILSAANSVGFGLGLGLAGWLASIYPWRTVFIIVGAPGLLLAVLLYFTAVDPHRAEPTNDAPKTHEGLGAGLLQLWRVPGLMWMMVVSAGAAATGHGLLAWSPTFLMRVHHLTIAEAGESLSVATIAGLVCGNLAGGWLSDWAGRRDIRWYAWVSAIGLLVAFPLTICFVLWGSALGALFFFFVLHVFMTLFYPALFSLALTLAPPHLRTMTATLLAAAGNLVGTGLGPLLIGWLSDFYAARAGVASIRYSLLTMSAGLLLGAFAACMTGRSLRNVARGANAMSAA